MRVKNWPWVPKGGGGLYSISDGNIKVRGSVRASGRESAARVN